MSHSPSSHDLVVESCDHKECFVGGLMSAPIQLQRLPPGGGLLQR